MKIVDFIVCDDIRREIGGKNTIIGVYDELNIRIPEGKEINWPFIIRLCFFIRIKNEDKSVDLDVFEFIVSQEGNQLAKVSDNLKFKKGSSLENITLAISIGNLGILKPGTLEFKIVLKKGKEIIEELVPNKFKISAIVTPKID